MASAGNEEEDLLDSATREAGFQDPLLTPTVKPQQPVTPPPLVPLTAFPPFCLGLLTTSYMLSTFHSIRSINQFAFPVFRTHQGSQQMMTGQTIYT